MQNLKVTVAQSTQTAIPELNKKEMTLNYLIIGEDEKKVIINVGEKTYKKVAELLKTNTTPTAKTK